MTSKNKETTMTEEDIDALDDVIPMVLEICRLLEALEELQGYGLQGDLP